MQSRSPWHYAITRALCSSIVNLVALLASACLLTICDDESMRSYLPLGFAGVWYCAGQLLGNWR
jgi:hypothetical protein